MRTITVKPDGQILVNKTHLSTRLAVDMIQSMITMYGVDVAKNMTEVLMSSIDNELSGNSLAPLETEEIDMIYQSIADFASDPEAQGEQDAAI